MDTKKHVWAAWAVHLYTSLGLVLASLIAVSIVSGTPKDLAFAFFLMSVATIIDATDGNLARRFEVKKWVPGFDGRRLDDLTDFLTYTFLPLLLLWRAGSIEASSNYILIFCLLASAYGFCQSDIKTDDGFFLGFPSYWNLVAFYIYVMRPEAMTASLLLVFFAVMTFVPLKYLYPSQPGKINRFTSFTGYLWGALILYLQYCLWEGTITSQEEIYNLAALSLVYPIFYLIASWYLSYLILSKR